MQLENLKCVSEITVILPPCSNAGVYARASLLALKPQYNAHAQTETILSTFKLYAAPISIFLPLTEFHSMARDPMIEREAMTAATKKA